MKKLEYSKIASKKLKGLRGELTEKFGDAFSADLIRKTLKSIRQLEQYPDSGVQIAKLYVFVNIYIRIRGTVSYT